MATRRTTGLPQAGEPRDDGEKMRNEDEYQEHKNNLKDDMIEYYNARHRKVSFSPTFEENDTSLECFYVKPKINELKQGKRDEIQVKSLADMFISESKLNKEIYLTAKAGLGKTTFSKYLAITWCQAHCPDERQNIFFEKDDLDSMLGFEFVFLLLLRDSNNLCSLDDIIFELIVSNLTHSDKFHKSLLQKILNREKCLVILDGLDEWSHPPEHRQKPCNNKSILTPHRENRETCSVLTTMRPWKLGVLNLKSSNELGKHVVLKELNQDSREALTRMEIQRLKAPLGDEALVLEVDNFNKEGYVCRNASLASVPLLLNNIICLWCDGLEKGNSKCELYINLIKLLLSRTEKLQPLPESLSENIPRCFDGHGISQNNFKLLMALGKLAYDKLINDKKENTLVFDGSVARTYLNNHDMTISLLTGLLTERTTRPLTRQTSEVSFPHKTIQEFFAAISISSKSDGYETVLENCKTVESILVMSTVFQFISGMNAAMASEISEGIMHVINEDERTTKYRNSTGSKYIVGNPLYHIQDMILSGLNDMPKSENTKLSLQDLFITDHNEQDLKLLSQLNKSNIKTLYVNAYLAARTLDEILEFISHKDPNCLQKLYYQGNWKETQIDHLLSPCLQSLSISLTKWTLSEDNLMERFEQIQNLQYLYISACTFSHEILVTIFNFISGTRSLKKVMLSGLHCNEHGLNCERMKLDFSNHSQLTKADLSGLPPVQLNLTAQSLNKAGLSYINLGECALFLSPEMVNIRYIELWNTEMSAKCLTHNVKFLETVPHSVTVKMGKCRIKPESERERFRKYVINSETFEMTDDDSTREKWIFEFNTRKPNKE